MRMLHTSDWHIGAHSMESICSPIRRALATIAELVARSLSMRCSCRGRVRPVHPSADAIAVCVHGFEAIRAAGRGSSRPPATTIRPRAWCGREFRGGGGLHLRTTVADAHRRTAR